MIGNILAHAPAPLLALSALLVGAGLTAATPNARLAWAIALFSALSCCVFIIMGGAHDGVARGAVIGLAPRLDGVGAFAGPLVAGGALAAVCAAGAYLKDWSERTAALALALVLCCAAGWLGALLARDLVTLLLAVEAAWLAGVGVLGVSGDNARGAFNGALRMLVAGGVSTALSLLGAGLVYRAVGVLELQALAMERIAAPGAATVGVGLVFIGFAIKAGAAPLHGWAGAAYGRAGRVASIVLGVLCVVGALAALIKVGLYTMVAPTIGAGTGAALAALGGLSVVLGSVQAIGAANLRRLVSYAGAAQAGCVLISVALGSAQGFAAALVQLVALAAAALALLGGGAAAGARQGLAELDGLGRRSPLASAAIAAGAASLMGAPLTIGFLGRWRLIEAGVGAGWWWAAIAAVGASLAGVFYGGRLIERLYFRRASSAATQSDDIWRFAMAPALLAAIVIVAMGIAPGLLLHAAERASGAAGAAP